MHSPFFSQYWGVISHFKTMRIKERSKVRTLVTASYEHSGQERKLPLIKFHFN